MHICIFHKYSSHCFKRRRNLEFLLDIGLPTTGTVLLFYTLNNSRFALWSITFGVHWCKYCGGSVWYAYICVHVCCPSPTCTLYVFIQNREICFRHFLSIKYKYRSVWRVVCGARRVRVLVNVRSAICRIGKEYMYGYMNDSQHFDNPKRIWYK